MRFGSNVTTPNRAMPVWVFIGQSQEVEVLRQLLRERRSSGSLFKRMSSAARAGSCAPVQRTQVQRLLKPRRSPGEKGKFQPEALQIGGSEASNFSSEAFQMEQSEGSETSV